MYEKSTLDFLLMGCKLQQSTAFSPALHFHSDQKFPCEINEFLSVPFIWSTLVLFFLPGCPVAFTAFTTSSVQLNFAALNVLKQPLFRQANVHSDGQTVCLISLWRVEELKKTSGESWRYMVITFWFRVCYRKAWRSTAFGPSSRRWVSCLVAEEASSIFFQPNNTRKHIAPLNNTTG